MSATTTTAATEYGLEDLRSSALDSQSRWSTLRQTRAGRLEDTTRLTDPDPALEASRLADSTVPDGGYGWVIVMACAVVAFWNIGISYCWGVYQGALVERGIGSPLVLSFCGSLSPALMSVVALFAAWAMRSLGTRKMALAGVAMNSVSQIGAGFVADSAVGLFFLPGILLGVGMSAGFMAISLAPAQYFKRKRGLANGIVYAGGGLGGAVMSIASNAMIEQYGVKWAFRITGIALAVTGLPAAWLIVERTPIQATGLVDWTLFRQPNFGILFLVGLVGVFPLFVPPFFIPLYGRSMGLSSSTGAAVLAGFNFSSAIGRILSGYLCDILGSLNTLSMFLVINALSMIALWPASTSLAPLVVFAILNGLTNGGVFATMPTVVGNVFGSARVSTAMGMIVTGWVFGYLFGAPIAGSLLEAYGGTEVGLHAYRPAMFYAGSVTLIATALAALMRARINKKPLAKV
ncbi:hypothetical protein BN1723_012734 [Verticillium longisporum]|uniref:Major facilitator superfamily (MFS) profile domain-containing protein n=1 Tax=Verticillium longisporum TaxID=100787 RepID=A0A0G4N0Q6_VERLO|nr:Aspyridones efflux protein apdF like [Verticillium longisporum]CRK22697.1 hypothetical protein BN1723_012734 [Verticillium longisporum]CRK40201.1 hypothetical protein BN1708_008137 [Verticillium longisporum]